MSGLFKIHEELPLIAMVVADYAEDATGCSLYITHPKKSFMVLAESTRIKQAWLRDLLRAIQDCSKRIMESNSVEEQVRAFYSKYNPDKLDDLPYILSKYKGREHELLEKLEIQYNKPDACSKSQCPEISSVLSPVPILDTTSTPMGIKEGAEQRKKELVNRFNEQQQEIVDHGIIVMSSSLASPSSREISISADEEFPKV